MKLEVASDSKNPLYDRREIQALASATKATPSRKQIMEELAKQLGVKPDCIVIDKIEQRFGRQSAGVKAKVYSSPESAKKFEKEYKFARTEGKKKAAEGAAAPSAPAAPAQAAKEKPAQEPAPK
ncbi:MAG: hypothetical protein NTY90_01530 [Candidatus Micrarchaeota archaeon]|nr:hypothetical protein [Candidatus Micrarchaeota archaeon]